MVFGENLIFKVPYIAIKTEMKHATLLVLVILLVSALVGAFFLERTFSPSRPIANDDPDFFVGVDIAYANVTAVKERIDQVTSFTNMVILGSTGMTSANLTLCSEMCQYVYDKGLYFIVYIESAFSNDWQIAARNRWGNHFLGLYVWDEPGGKVLDTQIGYDRRRPDNYSAAETQFINFLNYSRYNSRVSGMPFFTSDYALYWFDYKAEYDTVFAEFGWNYSRELNVDLVRGAAAVQNKDWGIIITWTYRHPPYIESGTQLFNDLKLAYDEGAKYVTIFDSNENYTAGILKEEHIQALQQFWQYVQNNPRTLSSSSDRTAFVLPDDYAYGFRGPNDNIWGLWLADNFTNTLCENLNSAMLQYGSQLDIVYDDPDFPNYADIYGQLIFWNGTVVGG